MGGREFWIWLGVTFVVSGCISFIQVLLARPDETIREVLSVRLMWVYLLLHSSVAALIFVYLPQMTGFIFSSSGAELEFGVKRMLIAALGYPILLRSSILDLRMGDKRNVGLGLDMLNLFLEEYIQKHLTKELDGRSDRDYRELTTEHRRFEVLRDALIATLVDKPARHDEVLQEIAEARQKFSGENLQRFIYKRLRKERTKEDSKKLLEDCCRTLPLKSEVVPE